jgi:hypothetical protein
MNKTCKLNFNINKDDQNINDYLFCWSELVKRPSRTNVYKNYSTKGFFNFFLEKLSDISIVQDVIPYDETEMVNVRYFAKLEEKIWTSFNHFDSTNQDQDSSFIGDFILYYDYDKIETVNVILDELNSIELSDIINGDTDDKNGIYMITLNQNGFDVEKTEMKDIDLDNFDSYHSDDTIKSLNRIAKKIKKSARGLTIFHGERGTGKTSSLNYLKEKIKTKDFLILPTSLFDTTINNIEFKNFLKKNKNSIVVLDDSELYFSDTYSKSNIFTNNLLQIIDGFDAEQLGINLLLILNCENESDIDPHLTDANHLLDIIEFGKLSKQKTNELLKHLSKKIKSKVSKKLSDILMERPVLNTEDEIGFV